MKDWELPAKYKRKDDAIWDNFHAEMKTEGVPGFPLYKKQRLLAEILVAVRRRFQGDLKDFAKAAKKCTGWDPTYTPAQIESYVDQFKDKFCKEDMTLNVAATNCEGFARSIGLLPGKFRFRIEHFTAETAKAEAEVTAKVSKKKEKLHKSEAGRMLHANRTSILGEGWDDEKAIQTSGIKDEPFERAI
jgi:L-rhamnose mutarotase